MNGAIAHGQAQRLREAFDEVFSRSDVSPDLPDSARDAFLRLVDVLESGTGAVVLPADAVVTSQQAAELLGVSRMTIVRLIDRGELISEGGGVHRRIRASELGRYRTSRDSRRRTALHELASEIDGTTPADEVVRTR